MINENELKAAEAMLNKKGESIKIKRNLFNPSGTRKYTLREALEYAARGPKTKKCKITSDKYPDLVALYIKYSTSIAGDGICKKINTKYFNPMDENRYTMQEFTERLKERGWNFESPHKRKFTEEKAEKIARAKAAVRGGI